MRKATQGQSALQIRIFLRGCKNEAKGQLRDLFEGRNSPQKIWLLHCCVLTLYNKTEYTSVQYH